MATNTYTDYYSTTIGYWLIEANDEFILSIGFLREKPEPSTNPNNLTALAKTQLEEYFSGTRTTFDLPLGTKDYTNFYQQVWKALEAIPYGQTTSYTQIAIQLQNPKAVRAVGMANGRNPFAIVIPCHRVIGKSQKLTGYAHGLDIKKWLLEHEGAIAVVPTLF